jgi:hypothetical protein
MAPKQKFIEGDEVRVVTFASDYVWEVYKVSKIGRKIRYSVRKLTDECITLLCNVKGTELQKVKK